MTYEEAAQKFRQRVLDEWIVDFCRARAADYQPAGLVQSTLDRVSGFDAFWFQQAVDQGLVRTEGGFFRFPQSGSNEQIFSSGLKGQELRKTYLWVEPVITIGACARLICQFGWPAEQIGAQSEAPYAFDLVGKSEDGDHLLVGEIKKNGRELDHLIRLMLGYCVDSAIDESAMKQAERNALKKVKALWKLRPKTFWALGPDDYGQVFAVQYNDAQHKIELSTLAQHGLIYQR